MAARINCLGGSVSEIHFSCCWHVEHQPANDSLPTSRLIPFLSRAYVFPSSLSLCLRPPLSLSCFKRDHPPAPPPPLPFSLCPPPSIAVFSRPDISFLSLPPKDSPSSSLPPSPVRFLITSSLHAYLSLSNPPPSPSPYLSSHHIEVTVPADRRKTPTANPLFPHCLPSSLSLLTFLSPPSPPSLSLFLFPRLLLRFVVSLPSPPSLCSGSPPPLLLPRLPVPLPRGPSARRIGMRCIT